MFAGGLCFGSSMIADPLSLPRLVRRSGDSAYVRFTQRPERLHSRAKIPRPAHLRHLHDLQGGMTVAHLGNLFGYARVALHGLAFPITVADSEIQILSTLVLWVPEYGSDELARLRENRRRQGNKITGSEASCGGGVIGKRLGARGHQLASSMLYGFAHAAFRIKSCPEEGFRCIRENAWHRGG